MDFEKSSLSLNVFHEPILKLSRRFYRISHRLPDGAESFKGLQTTKTYLRYIRENLTGMELILWEITALRKRKNALRGLIAYTQSTGELSQEGTALHGSRG